MYNLDSIHKTYPWRELMKDVVAFTTIRQGNPSVVIESIRAEVFLDTVRELSILGIPCVAVFADCTPSYLAQLQRLGIVAIPQFEKEMGKVRREALQAAMDKFPSASHYFWLEPEKPNMPRFLEGMINLMQKKDAMLGLFNRTDMKSYPEEQVHYYLFCRAVASRLIGFDLDYAFGPMVVTKGGASHFLRYVGEYGDKWEAILIPRLRIIRQRFRIAILPVDFKNDPRMTDVESGKPSLILKRIEQFNNVIPSLLTEWQR
jgi:hypothetical protein